MLLKVFLIKGVTRFGQRGNLAPRYIGPFEVFEIVVKMAYRLALPLSLAHVHNVFHVSSLRKCIVNPGQLLALSIILIKEDLSYEEQRIRFLNYQV